MFAQNFEKIQRPGDFNIVPIINLIPYTPDAVGSFTGENIPDRLNILNLVQEINIYEDITRPFITGDITVFDATNLFQTIPIGGFERLEMQLMSANTNANYNFTIETGHPQYIYAVQNRKQLSQNSQAYVMHFCSQEMIRNQTNYISRAEYDAYHVMVAKLLHEDLNSKKPLYFEETNSFDKLILPFGTPMQHIDHICRKSKSRDHSSSNFLFFENIHGFHYRSVQSLVNRPDGSPRRNVNGFVYSPKRPHIRDGGDEQIEYEMTRIMDYEVLRQFDTNKKLIDGAYCSELITHDGLYKRFESRIFNYLNNFSSDPQMGPNSSLPEFPFDDKGNGLDALPSRRFFKSATGDRFHPSSSLTASNFSEPLTEILGDVYGDSRSLNPKGQGIAKFPNVFRSKIKPRISSSLTQNTTDEADITQSNESRKSTLDDCHLQITVPGFFGYSAGDMIDVEIPRYSGSNPIGSEDIDPKLSGRYLIKALRHKITMQKSGLHVMIMDLRKDGFNKALPSTNQNTFALSEKEENAIIPIRDIP